MAGSIISFSGGFAMLNADFSVVSVDVSPDRRVGTAHHDSPCTSIPVGGAHPTATAAPQPPQSDPPAIGDVIRDISNGVRKAEDLDASTRQECVLQLSLDGFSNEEIACLLRVSERTVTRDRQAVRKTHALKPDCELGDELLGEFQAHVMTSIRRLTRLCNDPTMPPAVRVRADEAIGRIYQRFTEQVRRFSYAQDGSQRLAIQSEQEKPVEKLPENAGFEERLEALSRRLAARY